MQYCRGCRDEFQEWVMVCPDCQTAIVLDLPHEPEHDQADELSICAAVASSDAIADMWAGVLQGGDL